MLCVDNEPDILVGMRQLLERWGCEVKPPLICLSSLQALEQQWVPDVILSDYRLDHGRTGLEVLQQCRLRLGDCFFGVIISAGS
ncbi:response regulator [Vibrio metschnikovii]